jgi:hypothetical protein
MQRRENARLADLFAFADPEHFGAAGRAYALGGRAAVFHGDFLGIFHFSFGFAFYTISFHRNFSSIFINQHVRPAAGIARGHVNVIILRTMVRF